MLCGDRLEPSPQASDGFASAPLSRSQTDALAVKPVHNHVLIADDDPTVRGSLAAVLESEGYVVDEASNGIEAVTRVIQYEPDLVLLDLNMPYADGWTAFKQLDQDTHPLPVIVITTRCNQYKEAVRVKVDAFMEKPLEYPSAGAGRKTPYQRGQGPPGDPNYRLQIRHAAARQHRIALSRLLDNGLIIPSLHHPSRLATRTNFQYKPATASHA